MGRLSIERGYHYVEKQMPSKYYPGETFTWRSCCFHEHRQGSMAAFRLEIKEDVPCADQGGEQGEEIASTNATVLYKSTIHITNMQDKHFIYLGWIMSLSMAQNGCSFDYLAPTVYRCITAELLETSLQYGNAHGHAAWHYQGNCRKPYLTDDKSNSSLYLHEYDQLECG